MTIAFGAAELTMTNSIDKIFAGFSRVAYAGNSAEMGHGVVLRSTYAHLFSANMMAFSKPPEGKPHPPPWRAANGGFSYDIEVELAVPSSSELPGGLKAEEVAWLIAALFRLLKHPYLMLPVISDHPFDAASNAAQDAFLRQMETVPRILQTTQGTSELIESSDLQWVKKVWPRTADLLKSCPPLNLALRAADACTIKGKPASALLMAWGALEELFAPSRSELRFRVSAQIAAYLEPVGPKRLELFKTIADLYNARSKVAHTAQEADVDSLLHSFVILRNALIKMIDLGTVPTQKDLESLLFCGDQTHIGSMSTENIGDA